MNWANCNIPGRKITHFTVICARAFHSDLCQSQSDLSGRHEKNLSHLSVICQSFVNHLSVICQCTWVICQWFEWFAISGGITVIWLVICKLLSDSHEYLTDLMIHRLWESLVNCQWFEWFVMFRDRKSLILQWFAPAHFEWIVSDLSGSHEKNHSDLSVICQWFASDLLVIC